VLPAHAPAEAQVEVLAGPLKTSVAAPVHDLTDEVVAAISVVVPAAGAAVVRRFLDGLSLL
jgi:DNA-binding IclR family transcriptional regulator